MKFTAWGFYVFSFSFIFWPRRNHSLSIHWRRDTRKYKEKGKGDHEDVAAINREALAQGQLMAASSRSLRYATLR